MKIDNPETQTPAKVEVKPEAKAKVEAKPEAKAKVEAKAPEKPTPEPDTKQAPVQQPAAEPERGGEPEDMEPGEAIAVSVRSTGEAGHFRAGQHWPREGREAEVSEAQLQQLEADPRLVVEVHGERPGEAAKAKPNNRGRGSRR
jgi:hypothetical protein